MKRQNMKFMEMPPDEEFRLPALIDLSVDFLKSRIYVPGDAGGTFHIDLRVLENDADNVGADGKFRFLTDRAPTIALQKKPSKNNLLVAVEAGDSVSGLSISQKEKGSASDNRRASNWVSSLRMLDPEFSKQNLPGEMKCINAETARATIRKRIRLLIRAGQATLMKRRLERIILNTEPIAISKHFHSTVETGHIVDHFSMPAAVVFRAVVVR